MNSNKCVCCGAIIPEGTQFCVNCQEKPKMKLEQYKAIVDYCKENGYANKEELLEELKRCGILDERSPLEDLAEAVDDETYETMYNYLVEC
jgi:hypothetical protein